MSQNEALLALREMPCWSWALFLVACTLPLGCETATHTLLRTRCPANSASRECLAGEGALPATPVDAGGAAPAATRCSDESQCQQGEGCIDGVCTSCTKLLDPCNFCPPDSIPVKSMLGGCVVCDCTRRCSDHRECPSETVCLEGICTRCALVPPKCPAECPWRYQSAIMLRNQCKLCECVAPNECTSDAQCGTGSACYAGQQCDDGCQEPGCCHGNICAAAGCKPTLGLSCTQVGCAAGVCRGDPACGPESCKCDPTALGWVCSGGCQASCL